MNLSAERLHLIDGSFVHFLSNSMTRIKLIKWAIDFCIKSNW